MEPDQAHPPGAASTPLALPRLGRPVFTQWDAVGQALAIAPVFNIALVIPLVVGVSGAATPFAIILATICAFCLRWVITLYARRYVGAGGIYDYVRHISPSLGLFSACLYFVGVLLLSAAGGYSIIGLLCTQIIPTIYTLSIPWWVFACLAALLVFLFHMLGSGYVTRGRLFFTVLAVLPFAFLSLAIIIRGGDAGNTPQALLPLHTPLFALLHGTLVAVALFVGVEATPSLSEEVRRPRQAIPRATGIAVSAVAFLYLLVTYASAIGFGLSHTAQWTSDSTPLSTLAIRYVGSWFTIVLDVAVVINALTSVSAFTAVVVRGLFALSRHRFLPALLRRTSYFRSWSVIPLVGNLCVLGCALLVIITFTLANVDPLVGFGITITWGFLLIMATYLILAIAAIPLLLQTNSKWWHWTCLIVTLIIPLLELYESIVHFPLWPASLALYGVLGTVGAAAVWVLGVSMWRPDLLQAAAKPYTWERNANARLKETNTTDSQ
jgi:amino acid transporter